LGEGRDAASSERLPAGDDPGRRRTFSRGLSRDLVLNGDAERSFFFRLFSLRMYCGLSRALGVSLPIRRTEEMLLSFSKLEELVSGLGPGLGTGLLGPEESERSSPEVDESHDDEMRDESLKVISSSLSEAVRRVVDSSFSMTRSSPPPASIMMERMRAAATESLEAR